MKIDEVSTTSYEELLAKVSDPLVRAYEGLQTGIALKNGTMTQRYSQEFFIALTQQPKEALKSLLEEAYSDPFSDYFQYVPESGFEAIAAYLQLTAEYHTQRPLQFFLEAIAAYTATDAVANKAILRRLNGLASELLLARGIHDDPAAMKMFEYALRESNHTVLSSIVSYVIVRIRSFMQPNKLSDLKNPRSLWELLQLTEPDKNWDEVKELIIVSDVLVRSSESDSLPELMITGKDMKQYYKQAFALAAKLLPNEKEDFYYIRNVLKEELVQKEYGTDPKAKEMALAYVEYILNPDSVTPGRIESFQEWLPAYGVTAEDFISIGIGDTVVRLLIAGKIELADMVVRLSGYVIDESLITDIFLLIGAEVRAALAKTDGFAGEILCSSSRSIFNHGPARSKDFALAVQLLKRIERVKSYFNDGVPDAAAIPVINFSEDYYGKIMVFLFKGRYYIRGLRGVELHRQIYEKFIDEIREYGYADYMDEEGGASLQMRPQQKTGLISDQSQQYGSCDKEMVRGMLELQFPGWTFETK